MNNSASGRRVIALLVAASLLCAYSMVTLALPGSRDGKPRLLGELTSYGTVSVNGAQAVTGETVFPDSLISTAERDRATISLGQLARVELSAGSSIRLGFSDAANSVSLDKGEVRVSSAAGYSTTVLTRDGAVVADKSQPATFIVNVVDGRTYIAAQQGKVEFHTGNEVKSVAAGEEMVRGASAPTASAAASRRRKTFWILFGLGLAILVTVIIVNHDDDRTPIASPIT